MIEWFQGQAGSHLFGNVAREASQGSNIYPSGVKQGVTLWRDPEVVDRKNAKSARDGDGRPRACCPRVHVFAPLSSDEDVLLCTICVIKPVCVIFAVHPVALIIAPRGGTPLVRSPNLLLSFATLGSKTALFLFPHEAGDDSAACEKLRKPAPSYPWHYCSHIYAIFWSFCG